MGFVCLFLFVIYSFLVWHGRLCCSLDLTSFFPIGFCEVLLDFNINPFTFL